MEKTADATYFQPSIRQAELAFPDVSHCTARCDASHGLEAEGGMQASHTGSNVEVRRQSRLTPFPPGYGFETY
eukprot:scaffold27958_cov129-Isochrysis_galbana.AAC.1